MTRRSALFLQTATALLGIAVFVFLLWEPHIEGRNAHATLYEIYFTDTFLACAYTASIPFFVALYHVSKLFGDAGRNAIVSQRSLKALRTIKYCAFILIGSIAAAEAYLVVVMSGEDDIAGGVFMGGLVAVFSTTIAIAAARCERAIQNHLAAPGSSVLA